jgi:hypothetical protein
LPAGVAFGIISLVIRGDIIIIQLRHKAFLVHIADSDVSFDSGEDVFDFCVWCFQLEAVF